MQYSVNEAKELAIHLGMQYNTWDKLYTTFKVEPERLNFETLRRCLDGFDITFNDIKKAIEDGNIQNPHTLCKVSSIDVVNIRPRVENFQAYFTISACNFFFKKKVRYNFSTVYT